MIILCILEKNRVKQNTLSLWLKQDAKWETLKCSFCNIVSKLGNYGDNGNFDAH